MVFLQFLLQKSAQLSQLRVLLSLHSPQLAVYPPLFLVGETHALLQLAELRLLAPLLHLKQLHAFLVECTHSALGGHFLEVRLEAGQLLHQVGVDLVLLEDFLFHLGHLRLEILGMLGTGGRLAARPRWRTRLGQ